MHLSFWIAKTPRSKLVTPESRTHFDVHESLSTPTAGFQIYHKDFLTILGSNPSLRTILSFDDHPYAHEAGVYDRASKSLYFTSNQYLLPDGQKTITISRIAKPCGAWMRFDVPANVPFANGGVNYKDGVLFCAQGSKSEPGGLVYLRPNLSFACNPLYFTEVILDHFHGRRFNSPNDVVIHSDGSIWFTDPIYGSEQGITGAPELPNQVYRFEPQSGEVRAVVDGFGRPNGLCFASDEKTLYVTDTDMEHGDGTVDRTRVSHMSVDPEL